MIDTFSHARPGILVLKLNTAKIFLFSAYFALSILLRFRFHRPWSLPSSRRAARLPPNAFSQARRVLRFSLGSCRPRRVGDGGPRRSARCPGPAGPAAGATSLSLATTMLPARLLFLSLLAAAVRCGAYASPPALAASPWRGLRPLRSSTVPVDDASLSAASPDFNVDGGESGGGEGRPRTSA